MKKIRKEKGITLIALVITIIVLLILAGVTIATLTGEKGILTQANNVKEQTEQSELEEEVKLKIAEKEIDKYTGDAKSLGDYLKDIKGAYVEKLAEGTWYVKRENAEVTVYEDGEVLAGKVDIWDGTSETPEIDEENNWYIYNCAQLKYLSQYVNGEITEEEKAKMPEITEETKVYLMADLDLGARASGENWETETNEQIEWTPIGELTSANTLKATFEGNNHTIRGIYINADTNYNGIFGNATAIQNLTVRNSYIKGGSCTGGIVGALRNGKLENCYNINTTVILEGEIERVGGIVGQLSTGTKISNSSNSGTIKCNGKNTSGISYAGGVVGFAGTSSTVSDCSNTGFVIGEGNRVGGIVGSSNSSSTVSDCSNTGTVTGNEYAGGVVGFAGTSSTVSDCSNTGTVTGNEYVAGVVGVGNSSSTVSDCSNTGSVTGEGGRVGGVVGFVNPSSTVSHCNNTGTVTGYEKVGGVVGANSSTSTVSDCYNIGNVLGKGNLGGCVGITWGNIDMCYNTGKVSAMEAGSALVGGIVGQCGSSSSGVITINVTNCYNTGEVETVGTYVGGIIGWTSSTNAIGNIKNVYNSGKISGSSEVGGIIGRNVATYSVNKCYNKGEVKGESNVGALIGQQATNTNNLSRMYYLNTINLLAIGNMNAPDTVEGVSDDLNSFEEFLSWIESR